MEKMVTSEAIEAMTVEGNSETDQELLWRENHARMKDRILARDYDAFSLVTFLEKVAPLVPLLDDTYRLKYEYLKSLKPDQSWELESGVVYKFRMHHNDDDIYQYLSILWNGNYDAAGVFIDYLRTILVMFVRISLHGTEY